MSKCADCGFLACRNTHSRILEETEQMTRDMGVVVDIYEAPICFVKERNLWTESGIKGGYGVSPREADAIKSIIQNQRDCKQFVKWHQGFTPKEHQEMIDRDWLLKYQDNQRREDRKWLNEQQVKLVIIAGIFTAIGAVIGALATLLH